MSLLADELVGASVSSSGGKATCCLGRRELLKRNTVTANRRGPRRLSDDRVIYEVRQGFVGSRNRIRLRNQLRLMPNAPDRAELEAGIYRHLGLQPAGEMSEALIVTVAELEPATWPSDSKQLRAGLFLSVPFLGADRTKLDQALARVRKGFKRNEILPGWQVELSEEKVYSYRDDEAGAVLLTLPVVLTLTPA